MKNSANTQATNTETQTEFETNRDILKHLFKNRFGEFYIPENAEDETEHYNFESFDEEITDCWNKDKVLRNNFPMCEDLIEFAINNISWTFPSTFVNDISDNNC